MDETRTSRKTDTGVAIALGGILLAAIAIYVVRSGLVTPELEATALTSEGAEEVGLSSPEVAGVHVPAAPSTGVSGFTPELPDFKPSSGRAPSFDVVRVDPRGSALVAGYAEPGAEISILADGTALASTEADADGNFVAFFDAEPSSEPVALSMEATGAGDVMIPSEEVVMLFPREETAEAQADPALEDAQRVAATAIVRRGGIEVSSMVDESEIIVADQVTLGSIAYNPDGQIELSGTGPAEAAIRVYIDNNLQAEGTIGGNGRWLAGLDDLQQGLYRLRVDQIGDDGEVESRVETPFQRDLPDGPRPRPGTSAAGKSPGILATVQPGGTLWTISRLHYGTGVHYALIFTANRELIRDPDLIYPGQVLTIPGFKE
ncbi:LysM peptidoglycan-binding domain-containing protein [Amaricoccus macauensis]|uniref:LysM peptidoglycan-binding domain-containing protein n=1 Tax=Amaricoccus macauensis TaxID=57001 RepID=UPI003C7E1166